MSLTRIPAVPADLLHFWKKIHPNPAHGFFLGPSSSEWKGSRLYLSAAEPASLFHQPQHLEAALSSTHKEIPLPRFVGVFGFEAGRLFDKGVGRLPHKPDPLAFPQITFGDYRNVVEVDLKRKETVVYAEDPEVTKRVRRFLSDCPNSFSKRSQSPSRFQLPSYSGFSKMVLSAKKAIAEGDIYQANLSLRFSAAYRGDPFELYGSLSRSNPSAYACLMKMGEEWIVSTSPELLLRVEGREAVTRPIAGTRPRGKDSAEDRRRRGQLLVSPKERAEHIMLVDLERNDLGRVCAPGSVHVTERFSIERYSHVMHIVSEVRGRLLESKSAYDALAALFPGGTITGCPKIKSIEIIQGLEGLSRGPFYGSAGYFSWNGDAAFNILIRTALISKRNIHVQAGAGIVADSDPRREYQEVLAKARVLLEART